MLLRLLSSLLLAVAVTACTPTYNWREMPAADGSIQVAFPGKPGTETRNLPMGHLELPFTLTAVAAGGATFAVGHTDIPVAGEPEAIGEAMISSLVRHYPADAVVQQTVALRPLQLQRAVNQTAREIRAEHPDNPAAPRLLARVFRSGPRWVQVVAVGPPDQLSWETAQWFVDSIRLP